MNLQLRFDTPIFGALYFWLVTNLRGFLIYVYIYGYMDMSVEPLVSLFKERQRAMYVKHQSSMPKYV
jgi:hypothetical protein